MRWSANHREWRRLHSSGRSCSILFRSRAFRSSLPPPPPPPSWSSVQLTVERRQIHAVLSFLYLPFSKKKLEKHETSRLAKVGPRNSQTRWNSLSKKLVAKLTPRGTSTFRNAPCHSPDQELLNIFDQMHLFPDMRSSWLSTDQKKKKKKNRDRCFKADFLTAWRFVRANKEDYSIMRYDQQLLVTHTSPIFLLLHGRLIIRSQSRLLHDHVQCPRILNEHFHTTRVNTISRSSCSAISSPTNIGSFTRLAENQSRTVEFARLVDLRETRGEQTVF